MVMHRLLVVTLFALGSSSFATPIDELTISIDVDVNTDNGQHKHASVEIPGGRFLKQRKNTSKLYKNKSGFMFQCHR